MQAQDGTFFHHTLGPEIMIATKEGW